MNKYTDAQYEYLQNLYTLVTRKHDDDMQYKDQCIDIQRKKFREELESKSKIIDGLKEEIRIQEYTVKGVCNEHLNLSVSISPELAFSKENYGIVDVISRNAAHRMAKTVEENLGGRYKLIKEYERALRHINYLENYMRTYNVAFTQFGIPSRFS